MGRCAPPPGADRRRRGLRPPLPHRGAGPGRPGGTSVEFSERTADGRTIYGRCPRSRRDLQDPAAARTTATVDPSANCMLTFDARPGLSVTLLVRGERLADWRRAQVAAAGLIESFAAGAAASRV